MQVTRVLRSAAAARPGARCLIRAPVASTALCYSRLGLAVHQPLVVRQLSTKPLGLKDGASSSGISSNMRMLYGYIAVAMAALATVAKYKARDEDADESVRIFNMAKRAVVKDRRVFEAIGYPKDFEKITPEEVVEDETQPSYTVGSFRVSGDNGSAIVSYRQKLIYDEDGSVEASDVVFFDLLQVKLANGEEFSALDSYMQDESVVTHKKSESLGKKLFFPVIGGVVIGGISSFFLIRILRNRPFYVHKLVLEHVNNHDMARQWLGHPIKSNRKDYVGTLTQNNANYTISCHGPKGNGTLIVKAFKKEGDADAREGVMTTPGTSWKFSTLVLSIKRNDKRSDKHAKSINLLGPNENA